MIRVQLLGKNQTHQLKLNVNIWAKWQSEASWVARLGQQCFLSWLLSSNYLDYRLSIHSAIWYSTHQLHTHQHCQLLNMVQSKNAFALTTICSKLWNLRCSCWGMCYCVYTQTLRGAGFTDTGSNCLVVMAYFTLIQNNTTFVWPLLWNKLMHMNRKELLIPTQLWRTTFTQFWSVKDRHG